MQAELETFLRQYETAMNSHNFDNVEPLLTKDAIYWFSDGSFEGSQAIREAFEQTWSLIKNEKYKVLGVNWIATSQTAAACMYEFQWEGKIDGMQKTGSGRGTNVMVKTPTGWLMTHEHLSKYPV